MIGHVKMVFVSSVAVTVCLSVSFVCC